MSIKYRYFHSEVEVKKELEAIGCHNDGIKIMMPKSQITCLKLSNVNIKAAILLKQDMLSIGAEAALAAKVASLNTETTNILLFATLKQYKQLINKLKQQPFGLKLLAKEIHKTLNNIHKPIKPIKSLNFKKPIIMGILNITPDSFSDGGQYMDPQIAVKHAKEMSKYAQIIDIGGESTRPGSKSIPDKKELKRVIPIIKALKRDKNFNSLISIDTNKPKVAREALKAGAHIINDITGLKNKEMLKVIKKYKCPVIAMHMQGTPKDMQYSPQYNDVVDEIIDFFKETIFKAKKAGINDLILDPGIGFGKTVKHNLQILKRLKEFKIFNKPLLIGTSRKSFIGKISDIETQYRLHGTISSNIIALNNGANIIRVHDVLEHKRAIEIYNAVKEV